MFHRGCIRLVRGLLAAAPVVAWLLVAGRAVAEQPRHEFTTLIAHWAEYGDEGYLPFVEAARPDVAQVGFYGAHFWGLAHTPHGKGYPAHFPVQGHDECRKWFIDLNRELRQRGVKVVGHVNVKFLVGDFEEDTGPRGFFDYYRNHWNEEWLGKKPVEDPREFLEVHRDGTPIVNNSYSIGGMREHWACLNNPHWRAVLKAWTKNAVDCGVDGLIANYFYRHDCHCRHCVAGFKAHLRERYTADKLKQQFGIGDLETHVFDEIVGWHDPQQTTPLRLEMLRFSQIANKRAFDEVFIEYGRKLKPDLILAQWNHLGNFTQINGDERCLLPAALWGRGEDYAWYSTGGSAYFTDLEAGVLGEGTLQARYIRGAFDDKPFTLGKYESTRTRVAIAELAANGGAPMGFYTRFRDPAAREEIVRYYGFLRRYDDVFRANRTAGEVLLLYPRSSVHRGDVAAVERFKSVGGELLDRHVLFDVRPDDLPLDEGLRSRYAAVIDPRDADALASLPEGLSRFAAPKTVRVSASRPAAGDELTLHFVNYNRVEPEEKRSAGRGIADEKPIALESIESDVALPTRARIEAVQFLTPEAPEPQPIEYTERDGRLQFTVPRFLVYAVVRLETSGSAADTQGNGGDQ